MTSAISGLQYDYYSNPSAVPMRFGYVRTALIYANIFTTPVANFIHYNRVTEGGTITAIRINVNVVSGNICLAVYKSTGSGLNVKPGTRVVTTGTIACPAAGQADVSLGQSVSVQTGDWLAFGADNSTMALAGLNGAGLYGMTYGLFHGEVAFPAPVTPNAGQNNTRMISMIGVP